MSAARPRRALRVAAGVALLGLSLVEARREVVPTYEERWFRRANGASDGIKVPVRAVMQFGTFATVPILSAVAALGGRRRLATDLAVAGTSAWLLAKALKPIAGRARPAGALPDVVTREAIGGDLGWVSGHTAVATALGVTLAPELPPVVAPVLGVVVATVGFGRMYVGAHLPHDVVGGVGLGLVVSALASGRGPLRSGA